MNLNVDAEKKNTFRCYCGWNRYQWGMGSERAHRKRAKDIGAGTRQHGKASRLSYRNKRSLGFSENGGKPTQEDLKKQGVQARTGYTVSQATKHWFVNDLGKSHIPK